MVFVERLKSFQFQISRRLLSAWINPTILGCDSEGLGLNPDDIVCYVLPFRSIVDLLVTDEACDTASLPRPVDAITALGERRAIFFLGHPEGRLGRKTQRRQSARMLRLFEHQRHCDQEIKIVPVSLFWGHQPDQEKSLFKLIFSENWTVTSRFKKLLAIIFNRNHILLQFSAPISLVNIMETEQDHERQVRKFLRVLRVHFNHQKQAIIGPDLSHRRTLINTIISSNAVQGTIREEASKKETAVEQIEKLATSYAKEIASHQSYRVIRFFHVLLSWLWNKLYDGIEVNHIDRLKKLAQSHEIIYTPCHRSHIDYLLLSYVLYHNGLTPPHIAAGENLNLPVIGAILRKAGAFFMRRSFQGDALYKSVFDEYLHQMFIRGYSIEYFIEGGRSRTGRTLSPRTGMLNMTLGSFQRDSSMPICLMPVYLGYERVLESSTYLGELAGKRKKSESIFDIFKIFNFFKFSYGRVTVNFGEPLLLVEFLDDESPDWRKPEINTNLSGLCSNLAQELVIRINNATAVKVVNLVATALLSTPKQTMEEKHLLRQIELLANLARGMVYSEDYTVTSLSAEEILESAIRITGLNRNQHSFGITISASTELAILLTYYRNNISHLFALPSLIARHIQSARETSLHEITSFCSNIYPFIQKEFTLRWHPEEIGLQCQKIVGLFEIHGLIKVDDKIVTTAIQGSNQFASLHELAEIIEPTLERFSIVNALLSAEEGCSIQTLESDAAAIAQQLSVIYGINSPDFFEKSLFSTYIQSLNAQGLLSTEDGMVEEGNGLKKLAAATASTLDAGVLHNVLQAIPPASEVEV